MRKPNFFLITNYLEKRNHFVYTEEIIDSLVESLGKSRGIIKLYVNSILSRLRKRGKIVKYMPDQSGLFVWGMPSWLDSNGYPIITYLPDTLPPKILIWPCRVNPKHTKTRAILKS